MIRVASLTPHSSTISFRLPRQDADFRIAYRPMYPAEDAWQLSEPMNVESQEDWRGRTKLDNLIPGVRYECAPDITGYAKCRSHAKSRQLLADTVHS
jgi:hypothetical protein